MRPNVYEQYKQQSLNTLSQGEVLVKLFEECCKQLHIAQHANDEKDYARTTESMSRAQEIVETLSASLDMTYPVSQQLRSLYVFILQHLRQAGIRKDNDMIDDVLALIQDLRDSFDIAQKQSRRPQQAMAGNRAI